MFCGSLLLCNVCVWPGFEPDAQTEGNDYPTFTIMNKFCLKGLQGYPFALIDCSGVEVHPPNSSEGKKC